MRFVRIIWNTAWTVVLLAGIPAALIHYTPPLTRPDRQALVAWIHEPLTPSFVAGCLVAVCWLLWMLLVLLAVARIAAGVRARRRWLARLRLPAPMHSLAAALLGAAAVTTATPALAHTGSAVTATAAVPDHDRPSQPQQPTPVREQLTDDRAAQVTVKRHDTLWRLADAHLEDPTRWPEIHDLNKDRYPMRGGHHLRPGWLLTLPTQPAAENPPAEHHGDLVPPAPNPSTPPGVNTNPSNPAPSADPDGVIEPSTTPPAATTSPQKPHTTSANQPTDQPGVRVPGGWISIGLAAALTTTGALVWLRRRARYNPTAAVDPATDPTLQPLPKVISRLRRTVDEQAPELLNPPDPQPTVRELEGRKRPPLPPIGPTGLQLAGLHTDPRDGVGLTGPGAPDAARAILVATLSSGGTHDPDARGHIVIPANVLTDLLGAAADTDLAGAIPRLHVTAGLENALAYVEEQIIHRTRTITDADAPDIATLHETDPHHEPLPPITLITDEPDTALRTRLATALHLGHPLAISAVITGDWPHGTTLTVAADGSTTTSHGELQSQISVTDTETTLQLLIVIREAHTGEPSGQSTSTPTRQPTTGDTATATSATANLETTDPSTTDEPASEAREHTGQPVGPTRHGREKVQVRILGRAAILDPNGNPVPGVRRASYELLTYLAVHREGATIPEIELAMTPDATTRRARDRLSTNVANLRNRLTHASRQDTAENFKPVVNPGGRYCLDPALLDVDWWRVLDAARRATITTDPQTQRVALEEAVANWGGLLHDDNFEWMDGPQHTCRQLGVNIHARLATLISNTDPERARQLLDTACAIDPLNEEVAQQAMKAHAGDPDAIGTRFASLTDALHEIGEDTSENTRRLARQLRRNMAMSPHEGQRE
ncbi:BTAD domain-containing putative transcriptional regulator [Polymorphospora sp. NPDC050346]|uniref:BTAD domain-containing putative transcriptional regulator n=1 Tax=Polymorphospora sp. NPDC050346 TaxID=3155780 RepID=UPI003403DA5E